MVKFFFNVASCVLLFVELVLAICFIFSVVDVVKGKPNSLLLTVVLVAIMIPIAFAIRFLSKRLNVKKDVEPVEDKPDESLEQNSVDVHNLELNEISDKIDYEEWVDTAYVIVPKLPENLHSFELNERLRAKIITYKNGVVEDVFYFGKILSSYYEVDQFYIKVIDSKGNEMNVGFSKILSVEDGSFADHVLKVFNDSDSGRALKLMEDYKMELSILLYLGRADSSFTSAKRKIICDYLVSNGADCSDEVLAKVSRKMSVDLQEFKKMVNSFFKVANDERKAGLVAAARDVVSGRENSRPFGLAGLTYIDSKMKA